jgi:ribosome-binding protein aMBF1 (putative translation factor)
MSVLTIPAGFRGPHVLADWLHTRPCQSCQGEGSESYFDGLREEREGEGWSLRRMAKELGIPPSSLSAKETGKADFTEDEARRYLTALGLI